LPGCFPVDKSYGWIQASAKIRHFVLKAKSFAPTAAISFESNLQPPTVMLSGQKAIMQVVNCRETVAILPLNRPVFANILGSTFMAKCKFTVQ
jgi:hypothetical protein